MQLCMTQPWSEYAYFATMQLHYGCGLSGNVFILPTCIACTSLMVEKLILHGTAHTLKV